MQNRYEVSCNYCGVVGFTNTKIKAMQLVEKLRKSNQHCDTFTIFDRYAKVGKPEKWTNTVNDDFLVSGIRNK